MTPEDSLSRGGLRLATGHLLPDLRIVPRAQVYLHEDADPARVARLAAQLRSAGVLRNPPVAAPMTGGGYVVLDGANRMSALAALEAPFVPLQVVDYDDPAVRLEVWHHLLADAPDLAAALRATGVPVRPAAARQAEAWLADRSVACYILDRQGTQAVPLSPDRLLAGTLSAVVAAYKGATRIYRVLATDLDALAREYGPVGAVVVFPQFTKQDILEIASAGVKLPTGITRHLIPGRALRVDLPLTVLTSPGDAESKNRWLADTIHRKLLEGQIRYYPEATFLFDE